MDWVRSLRIGCGMISRGEVGLIVTAMGASSGIFGKAEVAVMVAVVLLTTLVTPVALRAAFNLKSPQDFEDEGDMVLDTFAEAKSAAAAAGQSASPSDDLAPRNTYRNAGAQSGPLLRLSEGEAASE